MDLTNHTTVSSPILRPSLRTVWRRMLMGDNPLDVYYGEKTNRRKIQRSSLVFASVFGVGYFIVLAQSMIILGCLFTLPSVYSYDVDVLFNRKCLALWWYIVMILNYLMVVIYGRFKDRISKRPKSNAGILPFTDSPSKSNTSPSFCHTCEIDTPPRAKHCVLCDHCILKRDHHCFFTGSCIGFHTQRFFTVFCLYRFLGCYLSSYVMYHYIKLHYVPEWYNSFVPITLYRWIFGYESFTSVCLVVYNYFVFTTGLACTYFFFQQLLFIYLGTTMYDFSKRNFTYRTNLHDHLQSVFGPYWLLNFIFPMFWLKNEGTIGACQNIPEQKYDI